MIGFDDAYEGESSSSDTRTTTVVSSILGGSKRRVSVGGLPDKISQNLVPWGSPLLT